MIKQREFYLVKPSINKGYKAALSSFTGKVYKSILYLLNNTYCFLGHNTGEIWDKE